MFETFAEGDCSKSELARRFAARGLRKTSGKPMTAQDVGNALKNRKYEGWIESESWGVTCKGDWEPIVDASTFARVQAVLGNRAYRESARNLDDPELPLRRFSKCSHCGQSLTGNHAERRAGRYSYYSCPNGSCQGDGENRVHARKEMVEGRFVELLRELPSDPGLVGLLCHILEDTWRRRHAARAANRRALEARLEAINVKRDKLNVAHIYEGRIDESTFRRQSERLKAEEQEVVQALSQDDVAEPKVDLLLSVSRELLQDPASAWLKAGPEERVRLQWFLFPEGVRFNGEAFGTAVTSPVYGWLRALGQEEERMVDLTGFEPVTSTMST